MDEDEDIIIEGTPLHSHLQETGFSDFEVMASQNSNIDFEKCIKKIKPKMIKDTHRKSVKNCILTVLGMNKVVGDFLVLIAVKLVSTKLLEEDDLLILEKLSPSVELLSLNPEIYLNKDYKKEFKNKYLWLNWDSLIAVWFAVIVAILTQAFTWQLFNIVPFLCTCVFILGLVSFLKYFVLRKFLLTYRKLENILFMIEKTNKVTKKALKFLNEVKVIRSGLKQKSSAMINFETLHEVSVSRSLHSLFESLLFLLQSSHSQLEKHKSLEWNSIDYMISQKFSLKFVEDTTDTELLYSNLKDMKTVLTHLTSTYLTELLLTMEFSQDTFFIHSVMREHYIDIEERMNLLTRVLNLSQSIWFEETGPKINSKTPVSLEKVKVDVSGAVDVLSLHSKMVAHLVMFLKENCDKNNDLQNYVATHFVEIQKYCKEIKCELTSCMGCLEEVSERVEKLYFENTKIASKLITKVSENRVDDICNRSSGIQSSIPLFEVRDRDIEDEVFEAVVDESSMEVDFSEDSARMQSRKKEKQMQKKERDRCKRVLQEIQPILQQRREMWKEREEKAIQRMASHSPNESHLETNLLSINTESRTLSSIHEEMILKSEGAAFDVNSLGQIPGLPNTESDNEYDSEEERLLLYKKVKEELDKDEAARKEQEDEDEYDNVDCSITKTKILRLPCFENNLNKQSHLNRFSFNYEIIEEENKNTLWLAGGGEDRKRESSDANYCSNDCDAVQFCCEKVDDFRNENYINSDLRNCLNTTNRILHNDTHLECENTSEEISSSLPNNAVHPASESNSIDMNSPVASDTKSASNLFSDSESFEHASVASESFSCGGDSSDEESKPAIDWNSCGFPQKRLTSCNNESVFNVAVMPLASEVHSKICKFTLMKGEEVFGGVGEGDEDNDSASEEES